MRSADPYQPAVKAFKQGLLNSPLGNRIMKIILFGSWAKGTAQEESDLDILVVGPQDFNAIRRKVMKVRSEKSLHNAG